MAKEQPTYSEVERLEKATEYHRKAREAGSVRQVVRKIHRDGKGIKSFSGIPHGLAEKEWQSDIHKIWICDARKEIAECGVKFCASASDASKKRYASFLQKELKETTDVDTANARAVLTFITLFASILRYDPPTQKIRAESCLIAASLLLQLHPYFRNAQQKHGRETGGE
jgi:hypothetical protein